jgi:hypothetical protein
MTTYYAKSSSGSTIEVARISPDSCEVMGSAWFDLLPNDMSVFTIDTTANGIMTIGDIRKFIQSLEDHAEDSISDVEYAKKHYMGKIEVSTRKSIFTELKTAWHKEHDFIEITQWTNGEGYDITVSTSLGERHISLHESEFAVIRNLISELEK